ncbi:MAG: hypothetical protein IT223_11790 [Crocinitomicaceae bacterium]|nr:hypothetical protein [Crocinitomicaceae bacterium]
MNENNMMQKKNKGNAILLFIFLCFILLHFSCKREEATTWDVAVSAPLIRGRLMLNDILADSLLQTDEFQLWHLKLTKNLTDFDLDSLVAIPDTIIKKVLSPNFSGGPFTLPNGTTLINKNESNVFQLNSAALKEVIAKSGFLEYTLKSYVNGYLHCTYEIPGISLNNVPVTFEVDTDPGSGTTPFVSTGMVDLTDHTFDLTGESGFQTNTLLSNVLVKTADSAPSNAVVFGHDSIVVELKFVAPQVRYAKGYFGQHNYTLNQMVDFGYQLPTGSMNIDKISMRFHIENYVGVDAQIKFNLISSLNSAIGNQVELSGANLYQQWNITRAVDVEGTVTPSMHETLLNEQNSNLDLFIENLPNTIQIGGNVVINPLGDVSAGNDFIYTDNALNAVMDIDLPLNIGAQNLLLQDTILLTKGFDNLQANGSLHLYVKNTFPFSTSVTMGIINPSGNMVSTLISDGFISSAIQGNDPEVTTPVSSVLDIPLSPAQVQLLTAGSRLVLGVTFNTPGYPDPVSLYQSFYLDYVITTDARTEISFE